MDKRGKTPAQTAEETRDGQPLEDQALETAAGGKGFFVSPITKRLDRVLDAEEQAKRKYTSEFSPPGKG